MQDILRWSHWHAAWMLCLFLTALVMDNLVVLIAGAALSFAVYCWNGLKTLSGYDYIVGRANIVTLCRLLIASAVFLFFVYQSMPTAALILLACLLLDGVDGYLARRFAEESQFGGYLDMEVDAYVVCCGCFMLWQVQEISALILIAGCLRYLYVLLVKATVRSPQIEPRRTYASVIAVLFYLVMVFNIGYSTLLSVFLLYCSIGLLFASFARSYVYQKKG